MKSSGLYFSHMLQHSTFLDCNRRVQSPNCHFILFLTVFACLNLPAPACLKITCSILSQITCSSLSVLHEFTLKFDLYMPYFILFTLFAVLQFSQFLHYYPLNYVFSSYVFPKHHFSLFGSKHYESLSDFFPYCKYKFFRSV